MHSSANASRLPLRARRTIQPDGSETVEVSVFCTHLERSIPVDQCGTCDRWAGMSVQRNADASFILCAVDEENMLPSGSDAPISTMMTRDVVCVRPEVSLELVTTTLIETGASGLPVVDERGHPVGVVTQRDLLTKRHDPTARAESILTPLAFTLPEDAPVSRAAALMAFEGIHRIPVVDADGAVVGIVSALDIARWVAEQAGWLKK